jgi:hypothetical protein
VTCLCWEPGADIELHNKYGETAIDLFKAKQNSETFEKLMIEYVLERGNIVSLLGFMLCIVQLSSEI